MGKDYREVFTAEELEYLERSMKEAAERVRRLPEISDEEDARIRAAALSDPDCPPLTDEDLARFRPAYQVIPEFVAKWLRQKRGTLPVETPKKKSARR
jgi:hypothetical protein